MRITKLNNKKIWKRHTTIMKSRGIETEERKERSKIKIMRRKEGRSELPTGKIRGRNIEKT
jgi:hypothetical protein